jgi:hypothetical protein
MSNYKFRVRTSTKFGQQFVDTVEYTAENWQQGIAKARKFAVQAYGYNNITKCQIEGLIK